MEITLNKTDELNGVIVLKIVESDYAENVEKSLKELRRNVAMNGFRKGNAPMGLVKKMYSGSVFIEELNKLVSDSLLDYIKENQLDILGEPLPSESNEQLNADEKKDFEFKFDVAFRPVIDLKFDENDKVDNFEILVEDEEINMHKKYYLKRHGEYSEAEISDESSIFTADILECDENGTIIPEKFIFIDAHIPYYRLSSLAQVSIKSLKVDETMFIKKEDVCTHESELISMLNLTEESKNTIPAYLYFTIKKIKNLNPAEINQDFFDKAFGEDVIHNEEEFTQKIVDDIQKSNKEMTSQKLKFEVRRKVIEKLNLNLPDEFLKRWIYEQDKKKDKTREDIDKEYPMFREDLKWHLISQHVVKTQKIEPAEEDYLNAARKQARMFYAQYGMGNVGDEMLTDIVDKIIKDKKQKDKLNEMIVDERVMDYLAENFNLETKKVTFEEYKKLNENNDEKPE